MGAHMRISSATAPLNNTFFLDRGLLEKAGKGAYKPTKIALDFQRKWTFDKAAAPAILAPAMQKDSWFYNAVVEKLEIGPTTRETMIDVLASLAETDAAYATQYGLLLGRLRPSRPHHHGGRQHRACRWRDTCSNHGGPDHVNTIDQQAERGNHSGAVGADGRATRDGSSTNHVTRGGRRVDLHRRAGNRL